MSRIDEKVLEMSTKNRILHKLQENQFHSPFYSKYVANKRLKGEFVPRI